MSDIKQKAKESLWKAFTEFNKHSIDNIDESIDIILDQAIQEDRERIIKLIKEKGLHLGYANDIIKIIREN